MHRKGRLQEPFSLHPRCSVLIIPSRLDRVENYEEEGVTMARTETKGLTAHVPLPLADLDAGRVIDQQAVQAWADSLNTDTPLLLPR